VAYFSVQPDALSSILSQGFDGVFNNILRFLSNLIWLDMNTKAATLWATAGLMLLSVILSLVISDEPKDSEKTDPFNEAR
jgi:hypothetical protein